MDRERESDLADVILKVAARVQIDDLSSLLSHCLESGAVEVCLNDVRTVWERFQTWPFVVELEEAQKLCCPVDSSLPAEQPAKAARLPARQGLLSYGKTTLPRVALQSWLDTGRMTAGLWTLWAHFWRESRISGVVLYDPLLLSASALETSALRLPAVSTPHPQPRLLIWPCWMESLHWSVFFYVATQRTVVLLHAHDSPALSQWSQLREKLLTLLNASCSRNVTFQASADSDFELFLHMRFFVHSASLAPADSVADHLATAKSFAALLLEEASANDRTDLRNLLVSSAPLRAEKDKWQGHPAVATFPKRLHQDVEPGAVTTKYRRLSAPATDSKLCSLGDTPQQTRSGWRCPSNGLNLQLLGKQVLRKPYWYNDETSGLVNEAGCQQGASCGLLALNHVLRSLRLAEASQPRSLSDFVQLDGHGELRPAGPLGCCCRLRHRF